MYIPFQTAALSHPGLQDHQLPKCYYSPEHSSGEGVFNKLLISYIY